VPFNFPSLPRVQGRRGFPVRILLVLAALALLALAFG
jgi:hypothetical protein